MRPAPWIVSVSTLLLLSPAAWGNVARSYYEDDADYPSARAKVVANQVALITIPVLGLYWVYYRSAHSQRSRGATLLLTLCRLALVVCLWFVACVPLLGGGPTYFLAGSRPSPVPRQQDFPLGPHSNAPQKSTMPETVAGTALSLAIVFGGLRWLRRSAQTQATEPT